jgi:hypothetical protein
MAPETVLAHGGCDTKFDVRSFAVLLWELATVCTLQKPFKQFKKKTSTFQRKGRPEWGYPDHLSNQYTFQALKA